MRAIATCVAVSFVVLGSARAASAQTADEVIEKSLAAIGGRAAHARIKTRTASGTVALSTPAGEIIGTLETQYAAPNKSRALVKADLSQLGAGALVIDQRFDGNTGYVLDSLQGNREMTASQQDSLRNNGFPHPFIGVKERGIAVTLKGKEKVGTRDAFVLVFDPLSGSEVRHYVDAETYMPLRTVTMVEVPQLKQEVEQTTDFEDYKEIDGVKVPFRIRATSQVQGLTITFTKVAHNQPVDDKLFVKP